MNEVCRGQCLFGKCPFETCQKNKNAKHSAERRTEKMDILTNFHSQAAKCSFSGLGIAVDIGTTTIAAVAIDLATSAVLMTGSVINPQVSFGPDVISRIKYARDFGIADLQSGIVSELERLISEISAGTEPSRISITGNTAMLCLFAGEDPSSMGVYPFTPPSLFGNTISAHQIGWPFSCDVYLNPCMGPFVGGDITSAVVSSNLTGQDTALLADIGTNGELALYHDGKLYVSSTAAGPAFEGATISCGMAAVSGAIKKVQVVNGQLVSTTIDGSEAKGICGSGLISAVSTLLSMEKIDESGLLEEEQLFLSKNVYLSRSDIREVQMAKSAICAGILALCNKAGISIDNIKRFCIAGGFGSNIDPREAAAIGLFPRELLKVTEISGNAALGGCVLSLLDKDMQKYSEKIASNSIVIDLATDPVFMDAYVENMMF